MCTSGCTITSKAKINIFQEKKILHFEASLRPLEKFQEALILAFQTNSTASSQNKLMICLGLVRILETIDIFGTCSFRKVLSVGNSPRLCLFKGTWALYSCTSLWPIGSCALVW